MATNKEPEQSTKRKDKIDKTQLKQITLATDGISLQNISISIS
jgi:hypothetical protein